MDRWVNEFHATQMVRFIDELLTPGAKLPQYLNTQYCEHVWRMVVEPTSTYKIWSDLFISKYYEKVDKFFYFNRVRHKHADYIFTKDLWKLKPEYEHRMIRAGYGRDSNKSFGKYFDIERAFHGFPGPLTTHLNAKFKHWGSQRMAVTEDL